MKIYCSCCDKVQSVRIDNCRDAKTSELYQDIVCAECDLVIASGTDIEPPQRQPLTDEIPQGVLFAINKAGLTLLKTQHGYELRNIGPAIAHGIKGEA